MQSELEDVIEPCGICGEPHECSHCDLIQPKHYIKDKVVLSKARLSLPNDLKITKMAEGSYSIQTTKLIEEGTKFGPFEAKKLLTLNPAINFPLKIFQSNDYFKEYYLDTTNEYDCNWMCFVQTASCLDEQNLMCYEDHSNIYYISNRQILPGEHFKVWYSPYYGKKMNKDALLSYDIENDEIMQTDKDLNDIVKKQQGIKEHVNWICKFCEKQEKDVINFAIHIKEHYHMQLRKICETCKATFHTRKALKKHITCVHSNENYSNLISLDNPKRMNTEKIIEEENNDLRDNGLGGPMLNEITEDNMDNTNVLLEHIMLTNFDIDQTNNLLENEALNLGVDNLLSENEFNFSIEEINEKFVCDICLKNFSRLKLLLKHLEAHTAKYICDICNKVFSRKENLVSHSCNTPKILSCEHCDKKFTLKKYLTRHNILKHSNKYVCDKICKKVFSSGKALEEHKCVPEKIIISCNICQKEFYNQRNLKRHLNVHYARAIRMKHDTTYLCEICSKNYPTKKFLNQHLKTHKEPKYLCPVCNKKIIRKITFLDHMELHKQESPHICTTCNQKFTLKRYLNVHQLIHKTEMRYKCNDCPKKFHQKTNLKSHYNRMHQKKCLECGELFETAEKLKNHCIIHYEKYFECPICKSIFKLKSSLQRHFKKKHPDEDINLLIVNNYERKVENENIDNNNLSETNNSDCDVIEELLNLKGKSNEIVHDIDTNLDYIVDEYEANSLIENNFTDKNESCKNLDDSILDLNSLEMEFEKNFNVQSDVTLHNQEVCLSMPELSDVDQNITFGENTYILENGIIEPLKEGKVVLYILDKNGKN